MKKGALIISKGNQLTIYVWKRDMPKGRVGHAALQTYIGGPENTGLYMSFWPNENSIKQFSRKGVKFYFPKNLAEDKELEDGMPPDVTVHLFSLDILKINEAFEVFKNSGANWSMLGSTYFNDSGARNCSGLTGYLLYQGGIIDLVEDPDFNFSKGTGTFRRGNSNATAAAIVGSTVLDAKIAMGASSKKIAAATKLIFFTAATVFVSGTALTPDDIAAIAERALDEEQEKYELIPADGFMQPDSTTRSKKWCVIL